MMPGVNWFAVFSIRMSVPGGIRYIGMAVAVMELVAALAYTSTR
jgi:hypothetical protein